MKVNKKVVGILIAVIVIAACWFIPLSEGLTREALLAMGIFLSAVAMWICESLPMSLTGMGLSMLMVLFGIYKIADAYRTFAGTAFFFVFATYAINAALAETTIPDRICAFFLRLTKSPTRLFVLGIMFTAALLSAIMSNMATCALIATLSIKVLKMNGNDKGSGLGKCLMIGIPFACCAGGFATPAGTPANIIAINLLENEGVYIRFLDWMAVGFPIMILAVLVCGFAVCLAFKPEKLSESTLAYANNLSSELGKLTSKEIKTLIIIGIEIVLWILSTWYPFLNTTLVAILAMAAMFVPGINVLDWKTYDKYANYDTLFMMGSITALVGGLTATGAIDWVVSTVIPDVSNLSSFIVFLICTIFVAVIHMFVPAGSAVLTLVSVPLLGIAALTGVNAGALLMIACFWSAASFLLPFDGVLVLSYSYGYFKTTDMLKCGVLPYLILIPGTAFLIPAICRLFGIG